MVLFCLISSIPAMSQDSLSVLFVGNSYTYANDLPTVFLNFTNSMGDVATVDSKTNGGFTFQNHVNDPLTYTKINARQWDYVVLQAQSQEPSFPTDQVNTYTLPPARQLADSIYANWYCSQAMYFMTWGRQNGDPQWDSIDTFNEMNERLRNAYVRFADSVQSCVAPVGVAWKYVRDNYPSINLYVSDGSHPSVEGTYLAACTFYASLFRKSPIGSTYTAGLDPTVVVALQNAAHIAVMDSLETWHLRGKADITIADFHYTVNGNSVTFYNDSWRSQNWSWSFGEGGTSQAFEPTHDYMSGGMYPVTLIAESECGADTLTQYITINILSTLNQNGINNGLKTLEPGLFSIGQVANANEIKLYNLSGQILDNAKIELENTDLLIDMRHFAKGIYCLSLQGPQGNYIIYLPVY